MSTVEIEERLTDAQQAATSYVIHDVYTERLEQITRHGYSARSDDGWEGRELAQAGACYADAGGMSNRERMIYIPGVPPPTWPKTWPKDWWSPKTRRADLVRAAALLVAEIERLDRAEARLGTNARE